jgi:GGDEF domain-containing protein
MRDLLAACVELDTLAVDVYGLFATATNDAELAAIFRQLQGEEREHLAWWADVQGRLDAGDVVPVGPGVHVTAYMKAIVSTLRSMLGGTQRALSDDDMLALAASLEFFALDPIFAQLIRESDPAVGEVRLCAYDHHIERLVATMEVRRSWTLAPHIAMLRASSEGPILGLGGEGLHDHVTGLPRRQVAEQAVGELCADPDRHDEPITVALVELALGPLYRKNPQRAEHELLHMVSAMTSLLRFTDLLARIDTHCFAVVMPATTNSTAKAAISAVANAISSIATGAADGVASRWVTAAVVTIPAGYRCDSDIVLSTAEELLGDVRSAGESLGVRELG